MAEQPPLYDLVLLLSENAPEEQRAKVLSDVEGAIAGAGGEIERNDDWGRRPTAYQINHQAEAEYHLLQFHSPPELIEELSHNLHIADGVLRFRVIKNRPGTPPAPSSPPPVVVAATASPAGAPRSDAPRPESPPAAEERPAAATESSAAAEESSAAAAESSAAAEAAVAEAPAAADPPAAGDVAAAPDAADDAAAPAEES